jgi:hypothetical protein
MERETGDTETPQPPAGDELAKEETQPEGAAEKAKDKVAEVKEKLAPKVEEVKEKLGPKLDSAKGKLGQALDKIRAKLPGNK